GCCALGVGYTLGVLNGVGVAAAETGPPITGEEAGDRVVFARRCPAVELLLLFGSSPGLVAPRGADVVPRSDCVVPLGRASLPVKSRPADLLLRRACALLIAGFSRNGVE